MINQSINLKGAKQAQAIRVPKNIEYVSSKNDSLYLFQLRQLNRECEILHKDLAKPF